MDNTSRIAWLSSIGALKRGNLRIHPAAEALTPSVVADLDAAMDWQLMDAAERAQRLPVGHVFALAAVRLSSLHHQLATLQRHERSQLEFWEAIADSDLSGRGYLFEVTRIVPLVHPIRLQQLGDRKFRGLVCQLEDGQVGSLIASLETAFPGLGEEDLPELAFRLPAPYVCLLTCGAWRSFLLPQVPPREGKLAGTSGLQFNLDLLRIRPEDLPVVPVGYVHTNAEDEGVTAAMALGIADMLRDYWHLLEQRRNLGEDGARMAAVQKGAVGLQELHKQLTPLAFVKQAREMGLRSTWTDGCRKLSARLPYKAAFLLRAMLMSGMLRNSAQLKETIAVALALVLPKSLQRTFQQLLHDCSGITPSQSTMSRWRLIVDVALMVFHRRRNRSEAGNWVRYMQADASVQHQRDFEHIVVCSIKEEHIADAFEQALELERHWRPETKWM